MHWLGTENSCCSGRGTTPDTAHLFSEPPALDEGLIGALEGDSAGEEEANESWDSRMARWSRPTFVCMAACAVGGAMLAGFVFTERPGAEKSGDPSLRRDEGLLVPAPMQQAGEAFNQQRHLVAGTSNPCQTCVPAGCQFSEVYGACMLNGADGYVQYCQVADLDYLGPVQSCPKSSGAGTLLHMAQAILQVASPSTTTLTTSVPPKPAVVSSTAMPAELSTKANSCDSCCPSKRPQPTVVIAIYEKDLCKTKILARSIVKHDPRLLLGKVLLCWVSRNPSSEYQSELNEIRQILGMHGEVEVVEVTIPSDREAGWAVQQAVKLKVAGVIKTDYYLVLDAKNAIMKNLEENSLFTSCNQAKIFGRYAMDDMPPPHRHWYRSAARVLGQELVEWGTWPASLAPMVLHTKSVLDLLDEISEPSEIGPCSGGLCDMFAAANCTEFTLYLAHVASKSSFDCIHAIEERPWNKEISASLWPAAVDDVEGLNNTANQVRAQAEHSELNGNLLFFGVHEGALDGFTGEWHYWVLHDLAEVYTNASLYSFEDWDDLAECVG